MYASRGMPNPGARASPFRDEALRGAAQPGPEPTQPQPPSSQGGFGSPAPFYGRPRPGSGAENGGAAAMAGKRPPIQQHAFQAGNLPSHGLARYSFSSLFLFLWTCLLIRLLCFSFDGWMAGWLAGVLSQKHNIFCHHWMWCHRPAGPGKQPRTAQLTIFYAGMVNVYDDVPYDKVSRSDFFSSAQFVLRRNPYAE